MTLPEVLLWQQLKQQPGNYQFRKQHPLGPYVLDFACIRARLAIEVDGEAHSRGDQPQRDEIRDAYVQNEGFKTIRIPATEVLRNMESVVTFIVDQCRQRALPNPPRNECRVGLPPAIQVQSGGLDDPALVARPERSEGRDGGAGCG
ncbi:MAG: DUF559 domain-containing protein [Sphingopyxis sp.]|nr:DUF559 domain-containing protein [Sphingopyxis sp.]